VGLDRLDQQGVNWNVHIVWQQDGILAYGIGPTGLRNSQKPIRFPQQSRCGTSRPYSQPKQSSAHFSCANHRDTAPYCIPRNSKTGLGSVRIGSKSPRRPRPCAVSGELLAASGTGWSCEGRLGHARLLGSDIVPRKGLNRLASRSLHRGLDCGAAIDRGELSLSGQHRSRRPRPVPNGEGADSVLLSFPSGGARHDTVGTLWDRGRLVLAADMGRCAATIALAPKG